MEARRLMVRSEWLDRAVERVVSSRPEQGLPLKVEDPVILRRVATVLRGANAEQSRANGHKNGHANRRNGHG